MPIFVRHAEPLLRRTRCVVGDTITDRLLKASLFGHFCAGENETEIQNPIHALQRAGIGSILDFAAEDDVAPSGSSSSSSSSCAGAVTPPSSATSSFTAAVVDAQQPNAADTITSDQPPIVRVYDYESEAKCDRHVHTFRKCIQDVATLQSDGFAAVKVTALCNPKLLERMSRAIVEAQNLFAKFDTDRDGYISRQEFEQGFQLFFRDDTTKLKDMLEQVTHSDDGKLIDYISWSMLLRPEDLPSITSGCKEIGPLALATPTDEEVVLISKLYHRGHELAQHAAQYGTRLLIDAEQTRFQPAIDTLVLELQRTYNTMTGSADSDNTGSTYPIVYHTYQCYLRDAPHRIRIDLERSRRFGYHFGAKLVRGAYMESERALASAFDYPSPIHDTLDETHLCYNQSVKTLLQYAVDHPDQKVEVMLATHNQQSVEQAIAAMNQLGVDRRESIVSFGQLYGMKDHLTYNLGKNGYRAYKYVPYGEVKMVMPYLIRRANENSSIAGGANAELTMILQELSRRLTGRRRLLT